MGRSLRHTLTFCPNMLQCRLKNMYRKESLNRSSLILSKAKKRISSRGAIVKRLRRRQYDPAIIERTIGLVLGTFTTLYGSFLKRYTLTNNAVGTL